MTVIVTKDEGYESEKFAQLGFVLNTGDLFYKFNGKDFYINPVECYLSNGNNVFKTVDMLTNEAKLGVIIRASNNKDAFFAKVFSKLFGDSLIFERPVDNYTTNGIPKINSELKKHFNHGTKITWYTIFSKETLITNVDKIEYPVVYKPADGNHGKGIKKIDNLEQLIQVADEHNWKYPMFLQEFLDKKLEYRVITFNRKVINFAKKALKTKEGNQFAGRRFVAKEFLHEDYISYIQDYANDGLLGIDIIRLRDGRVYFVEQNRTPEWESLDKATGKNTAKLIKEAMLNE